MMFFLSSSGSLNCQPVEHILCEILAENLRACQWDECVQIRSFRYDTNMGYNALRCFFDGFETTSENNRKTYGGSACAGPATEEW